jgi:UDP-GlcNAc:undecaprenyl-phosphate GlcNAc-1-phosphate transferase
MILIPVSRKIAIKAGLVAKPKPDRYHQGDIPLGGGIAIFATLAIVITSAIIFFKILSYTSTSQLFNMDISVYIEGFAGKIGQLIVILLSISVLFLLGLIDDKKNLGWHKKLIVQFIVALTAAWFADIRVELFIPNKIFTSMLSAFWIVLLINVFNFLDNMDGACAGIAVIVMSLLFTAAAQNGQVFVGGLSVIFVGSLLGFLFFNFPPAKIFAGDAGSLVIGFMVAVMTLRTTYYQQEPNGQWYAVLMPPIVMAVPLYDFTSVTILRISQGKSPFVGDTQHFSHRLKRHGLTDTQTVLTLYLATLCTGLGATFLYKVGPIGAALIFTQTIMVLAIIAIFESTIKNDKLTN